MKYRIGEVADFFGLTKEVSGIIGATGYRCYESLSFSLRKEQAAEAATRNAAIFFPPIFSNCIYAKSYSLSSGGWLF